MDIYKKQREELKTQDYFLFIHNELLNKLDLCGGSVVAVPFAYEDVSYAIILDIVWKGDIHFVAVMSKCYGWYYVMRDGQKISQGYHFWIMKDSVIQGMQHLMNDVASGRYNNKKTLKEQVRALVEERGLTGCMNTTKWKELLGSMEKEMKDLPFMYKTVFEEEEPTEFGALGADEYMEYMDMAEVEWMKFHPVFELREYQGLLVEPKTVEMNYEKELREVLEKYHIPFEYDESNKIYTVYGYR